MDKGTALPKNIRQIGDIRGRERICIEDYVMTYIRKKEQQEREGYLGIFFGERQETEDSEYIFIRGIFEIPQEMADDRARETVREEYRRYFGDWEVQGCCVIGSYPTERMKALSAWIPEAGALIYHLQDQEETLYRISDERYRLIHGYFVFYEQNRRMQDYLGTVFRDESVEKESPPDRAIRSFREKVKEKGERKRSSFLRMAGSFFVIAVLIIGAIAVNRIEDIRSQRSSDRTGQEVSVFRLQREGEGGQGTVQSETSSAAARTSGTAQYSAAQQAAEKAAQEVSLAGSNAFWDDPVLEDDASWQESEDAAAAGSAEDAAQTDAGFQADDDSDAAQDTAAANSAQTESGAQTDEAAGVTQTAAQSGEDTDTQDQTQAAAQEAVAVRNVRAAYVIREGDTLAGICSKYYGGLDHLDELCQANGIEDADVILPGQRILLP